MLFSSSLCSLSKCNSLARWAALGSFFRDVISQDASNHTLSLSSLRYSIPSIRRNYIRISSQATDSSSSLPPLLSSRPTVFSLRNSRDSRDSQDSRDSLSSYGLTSPRGPRPTLRDSQDTRPPGHSFRYCGRPELTNSTSLGGYIFSRSAQLPYYV